MVTGWGWHILPRGLRQAMQRGELPFILLFSVWGSCRSNNKFFFPGRGHQISTKQHFLFKREKSMRVGRGITLHFSAPSRKTHSFIVTAAEQQGLHTVCFSEGGKWSQEFWDGAGAECGNGPSLLGPVKFWGTAPSKRAKGWPADSKAYAEFIKNEVNLIVILRKSKWMISKQLKINYSINLKNVYMIISMSVPMHPSLSMRKNMLHGDKYLSTLHVRCLK